MELPPKNTDYKDHNYWDNRYEEEETFDWISKYSAFRDFRDLVQKTISRDESILMLGCGNSELSEEMYRDGYEKITNIDYSPVVIDNMRERCKHMPQIKWEVMDIRDLQYKEESFDVVFEKGTLDALLVTETSPWQLSEEGSQLMDQILKEVSRVLKPGGIFISVTFAQPHFRQLVYAKPEYNWDFKNFTFGTFFHFFYYVMTKGLSLSEDILHSNEIYKAMSSQNAVTEIVQHEEENEEFLQGIHL